jgi:2-hydroxymuconate-semialdehyde hydrolase
MGALAFVGIAIGCALATSYLVGCLLIARREPEPEPVLPSEARTAWIRTRSGRVNVLERGTGDAVVLIHGSGRSVADWEEGFADALARGFRVVAFDNYGFGQSDRTHRWTYGIALWARQAIDLLDALQIDRAIILGHSSGAAVAAAVAADHPERVRGAVFVGHGVAVDCAQVLPAIPGLGEVWASQLRANGEIFSPRHRSALEASYRIRGTHAALLTFVRRQFTIDGWRFLRGTYEGIHVPILQVHGTEDASIPLAAARQLSRRIADARFVTLDGTGHNVHYERPAELAEAVQQFAAALGR